MKAAAINKVTSSVAHVHLLLNQVCRRWRSINAQLTVMFRHCECFHYSWSSIEPIVHNIFGERGQTTLFKRYIGNCHPRALILVIISALLSLSSFLREQLKTITGRTPRSWKLPILNLLTGQKSVFFRPGATRCTDLRQTWLGRRAPGSGWLCKILPQSVQGG